jgi:hypothetical protein
LFTAQFSAIKSFVLKKKEEKNYMYCYLPTHLYITCAYGSVSSLHFPSGFSLSNCTKHIVLLLQLLSTNFWASMLALHLLDKMLSPIHSTPRNRP